MTLDSRLRGNERYVGQARTYANDHFPGAGAAGGGAVSARSLPDGLLK